MNLNHGADDLELDDQPLAIVQANQQETRQSGPSCAWTPVINGNAITAQPSSAPELQAPENRIPGPAGRPATLPNGSAKSIAYGGAAGGWSPAEFLSPEWQAGLRLLNLPEFKGKLTKNHPLLQGNTVQAATSLKQSGIIPKLLLYIVSMHHAHNGESYVKFRDPTGTIGGTLVSDVLSIHQNISRGSVVLLEKVTVLRTPPPHSVHHLCIVPENVVRVMPRQRSSQSGGGGGPLFSVSAPVEDGRGRSGGLEVGGASAGGQGVFSENRTMNQSGLQRPSQVDNDRTDTLPKQVPQQQQQQQEQQLHAQPLLPPPQHQQPYTYVQPQVDTADDLLDGLDDEFEF